MRYVNHSCNPNAIIQEVNWNDTLALAIISSRQIKYKEEITFDYNSLKHNFICFCESDNCRGSNSRNVVSIIFL